MAWPLPEEMRPYIQMALYWQALGRDRDWIMEWARTSRHHYNLDLMEAALPEAARAAYFAGRIHTADPNMRLSQLWGLSARAAWYAGYGRAPTQAERDWAYTRPQEMLGLMFQVSGRGANTGRYQSYTVPVNVSWSMTLADALAAVEDAVTSGRVISGDMGSEPLRADSSLRVQLVGGALLERHIRAIP